MANTNLGAVSSYAEAREGGYTGTKEEWQRMLAGLPADAEIATQKAQDAAASAGEAAQSLQDAQQIKEDVQDLKDSVKDMHDEVMQQESANKQDKDLDAIAGNVAMFDNEGDTVDSDIHTDDVVVHPGVYDDLNVGLAKNLQDPKAAPTNRKFGFDTACGEISISDDANATVKMFKGQTHVVNQLVKPYESVMATGDGRVSTQYARGTAAETLTMQARSVVLNQQLSASRYTTDQSIITKDKETGAITVTGSVESSAALPIISNGSGNFMNGHTYLFHTGANHLFYVANGGTKYDTTSGAKFTSSTNDAITVGIYLEADVAYDGTYYPQLVDLTEYFNYDQTLIDSITSWDDLVAYDSIFASYVPYNTGEVKGLTPTVQVIGKNIANPQVFTDNGGVLQSDGSYYFATSSQMYGKIIYTRPANYSGNVRLTGQIKYSSGVQGVIPYIRTSTGRALNLAVSTDKAYHDISYSLNSGEIIEQISFGYNSGAAQTYIKNFQIEFGSEATAYAPYVDEGAFTSPQPLYGIDGKLDNYDAVTGKYSKRIQAYTFTADKSVVKYSDSPLIYAVSFADRKKAANNVLLPGFTCVGTGPSYLLQHPSTTGDQLTAHDTSTTVYMEPHGYSTVEAFKQWLIGQTIYYELDTPIVTDYESADISLGVGVNTAFQTSGERAATLSLGHEAASYDLHLTNKHKYIYRDASGDETYLNITASTTRLVDGNHDKLIDLSWWFGYGYEPATIAAFYALYPSWKTYDIPYTAPVMLNYRGTGVQTIGFNFYDHSTGTADLLGGNRYQICGHYESVSYVDQWGTAESLDIDADGLFTPTNDGTLTIVDGNDTDTCVHLVWRGYKNYGEDDYAWEPFTKNIRNFPAILEQFPEGMRGFYGGYDSLTANTKTVGIIGVALTGNENWLAWNQGNNYANRISLTTQLGLQASKNVVITDFEPVFGASTSTTDADDAYWVSGDWLAIRTWARFGTNGSNFQTYLRERYQSGNPVVVWGCALNPVVTPLADSPNFSYPVNDFGTERSLPINTTELVSTDLDADIQYSIDFTRTVQHYSEIEKDVEDLVEDKDHIARDYGDYPRMGSGYARNLVDPNAVGVDRLFSVDTSCGLASITDNGTAIIESMKGRTLNWNQLVYNGDASHGTETWNKNGTTGTVTVTADSASHTIVFKCGVCPQILSGGSDLNITGSDTNNTAKAIQGHVCLAFVWFYTDSPKNVQILFGSSVWSTVVADKFDGENVLAGGSTAGRSVSLGVGWHRLVYLGRVSTSSTSSIKSFYISDYQNMPAGCTFAFRDFQFFDLTQMFGYGKEPRKIADFRALFPEPFYDYDPGIPMNYKGTGVKTVGFNQYKSTNAFIRVRPQAYQITGTYTSLNYSQWPLRTAPTALMLNQVTVFNTLYSYQNTYYTALSPIEDYDNTKTYRVNDLCVHDSMWSRAIVDITTAEEWNAEHWVGVGVEALSDTKYFHSHALATDSDGVFTPPDFGWLYVLGGNDTDTCVHFTWKGYRNGQYEPYWEETRDIDVSTYFPDGMNGVQASNRAGDTEYVCDELTKDSAIQRIYKKVFTGSESFDAFTLANGITNSLFYWRGATNRGSVANSAYDLFSNYLTPALMTGSSSGVETKVANGGSVMWNNGTGNIMYIVPPASWGTITTEEQFKAKLKALYDAGKPLIVWYILKIPIVTPITPALNLSYTVADFGTEAALPPAPTSFPVDAVIKYSTDFMRELSHMVEDDIQGRVTTLEEDVANKADKNGDHRKDGLIANAAGNLIDANATPVPAQFSFRTTAGDASVAAQGVAEMQACRGTTHTWNQLAEDYHANTMDVFGEGHVTDAKGGALESNVFQGETIVSNQLVPASVQTTVNGADAVQLPAAATGDVHSLKVTGRTLVRNQLVQNGDFSDGTTGWSEHSSVTVATSGNVLTCTAVSDVYNYAVRCTVTLRLNHVYLVSADLKPSIALAGANYSIYTAGADGGYSINGPSDYTTAAANVWTRKTSKFTCQHIGNGSGENLWSIYPGRNSTAADQEGLGTGGTLQIRNAQCVDLTQLFNGDTTLINSITTWDDLVALMLEYGSYVAKDTGTLVSRAGTITTGVWNQLINSTTTSGLSSRGCTATVSGTTYNVVNNSTWNEHGLYKTINKTHKYYFTCLARTVTAPSARVSMQTSAYISTILGSVTTTTFTRITGLVPTGMQYVGLVVGNSDAESGIVVEFKDVMLIDLTVLYGVGNEPDSTTAVETDCARWSKTLTTYQAYDTGTPLGGTATYSGLNGVGSVQDEKDLVTGIRTQKVVSYTFTGEETWVLMGNNNGTFAFDIVGKRPGLYNAMMIDYVASNASGYTELSDREWIGRADNNRIYVRDTGYVTAADFSVHMTGKTIYYQRNTSAEIDDEDPQPLTMVAGGNVVYETQPSIAGTPIELSYDTTSFNIDLDTARIYYTKLSGVESIQTGRSALSVDATQDKVMDLTLAYAENRPSTVDELKSRYPGVTSLGDYDRGHFVHASGGVWITGVWNQLVEGGDFADLTAWTVTSGTSVTVQDNTVTLDLGPQWKGMINHNHGICKVGHKLYIQATVKLSQENDDVYIGVCGGVSPSYMGLMSPLLKPNNTEWETLEKIQTCASFGVADATKLTVGVGRRTGTIYEGLTVSIKNFMLIDLTALCGAGNEPDTVEEAKAYCSSIGHDLSTYQAYDAGTPLGGSVDLTGIELKGISSAYHDTYSSEDGKHTQSVVEFAVVNTYNNWTTYIQTSQHYYGFSVASLPYIGPASNTAFLSTLALIPSCPTGSLAGYTIEILPGANNGTLYIRWKDTTTDITNILPSSWIVEGDPTQPNLTGFKEWLGNNPFSILYRRATATTTTIQQQHVTLQPGFNAFYQAPIGTLAAHNVMTYLGTEWTLKLGSGRKYLYRHEGVDTILAPSSNMDQPIVSGDKLVDLTWLFGKNANVPATLEDCYALYPHMRGDMPYCASKMMNFTGLALRTVGFNLWDGRTSATGKALDNQGNEILASNYSITSYIRVVGNLEYEITHATGSHYALCWYDIDQKLISVVDYLIASGTAAKRAFAPTAACYARFTLLTGQISTCVFHLCWRGYRNYGTDGYAYEPYKESVRDMRVTDWFPDGLASEPNSGRYDELTQTKAIQRIARKVLTGSEAWTGVNTTSVPGYRFFRMGYAVLGSGNRVTGSQRTVSCNLVITDGMSVINGQTNGACQFSSTATTGELQLMLPWYLSNITTVAQLQTYLTERYESGDPVVIQWPLATPVETDISDEIPQLSYNYEDFGLEEIIPPNEEVPYTPPASLLIVYQKDFTRDVSNLPENYISKESLADLNAQIGPALNGVISGKYNSATGKFDFTFTKNPTVAALSANSSAPSLNIGMTYTQSPTVNVTYTLPTPSDLTQDNTIIVDVTCSNHTIAFSYNSTTVAMQKPITPATGIKYRFICSYAFSAWKVFALEVI